VNELILHLVKQLVDKPDQAEVTVTEEGDTARIMIRVAEEDKGKIIGKQGKVIKALRDVMAEAAAKQQKKVLVDLE